jgi:hypothetical protein
LDRRRGSPPRETPTRVRHASPPAFYDGHLFTINFKQEPSGGEASLLAHNGSINTIYMSDQAEAAGVTFTSVLDAIQGDGFNPLWQEVQIVFLTIPPQQFFSDNEILAAAATGQIALVPTTEVYRCSVVGTTRSNRNPFVAPEWELLLPFRSDPSPRTHSPCPRGAECRC